MERRVYERIDLENGVPAVFSYWLSRIPCKIVDISKGGLCFLISGKYYDDISNLKYGAELKFGLKYDEAKGRNLEYTCFYMHTEKVKTRYKIGVATSSEIYDRFLSDINSILGDKTAKERLFKDVIKEKDTEKKNVIDKSSIERDMVTSLLQCIKKEYALDSDDEAYLHWEDYKKIILK